jgi:hypothetical protein
VACCASPVPRNRDGEPVVAGQRRLEVATIAPLDLRRCSLRRHATVRRRQSTGRADRRHDRRRRRHARDRDPTRGRIPSQIKLDARSDGGRRRCSRRTTTTSHRAFPFERARARRGRVGDGWSAESLVRPVDGGPARRHGPHGRHAAAARHDGRRRGPRRCGPLERRGHLPARFPASVAGCARSSWGTSSARAPRRVRCAGSR